MAGSQTEIDAILAEAESALATLAEEKPTPADRAPDPPPPPAPRQPLCGKAPHPLDRHLSRVLHIEVPVIVRLAERSMPLKAIMQLATGSIIEFEKPADDELDLMVNNTCVGHGQAVKVGENFGLCVSRIESVKDKIQAISGR